MAQSLVIGVSIFCEREEHGPRVSQKHRLLDIKKYPTDDILTDIQSAQSIERGLVRFRQVGRRVLSRASEGKETVAMLTESEVC